MKELYSAEMLASLNGKLKKRWILVGVISALLLAAFVWSVVMSAQIRICPAWTGCPASA